MDDSPSSGGAIRFNGNTYSNGAKVTMGCSTVVTIQAQPAAGYSFSSWSVSGAGSIGSPSANPTTFTSGSTNGDSSTLTAYYNLIPRKTLVWLFDNWQSSTTGVKDNPSSFSIVSPSWYPVCTPNTQQSCVFGYYVDDNGNFFNGTGAVLTAYSSNNLNVEQLGADMESQFGYMPNIQLHDSSSDCVGASGLQSMLKSPSSFINAAVSEAVNHSYQGYVVDIEPSDSCMGGTTYTSDFTNFVNSFGNSLHDNGMKLYVTVASWQSTAKGGWINFNAVATQVGVDSLIDQNYASCYDGAGCGTGGSQYSCNQSGGNPAYCVLTEYNWWTSSTGGDVPVSKTGEALEPIVCGGDSTYFGSNCLAGNMTQYILVNDDIQVMGVWPGNSNSFLDPTGLQYEPVTSTDSWYSILYGYLQNA